ncbi:MAG: hypothetical protein WBV98_14940, partial [Candidatus Sulfotelmatobacter sp.]
SFAVVLEDEHVAHPLIPLQIDATLTVSAPILTHTQWGLSPIDPAMWGGILAPMWMTGLPHFIPCLDGHSTALTV